MDHEFEIASLGVRSDTITEVEKIPRILVRARDAYQKRQYIIALGCFQHACELDPSNSEALLGIGEVAAQLGFRGDAIDAFLRLTDIYLAAGMSEVAAEVVARVLELDPEQPIARRVNGLLRNRINRPTQSRGETATQVFDQDDASVVTSAESVVEVADMIDASVVAESIVTSAESVVQVAGLTHAGESIVATEHSGSSVELFSMATATNSESAGAKRGPKDWAKSSTIINRELDEFLGEMETEVAQQPFARGSDSRLRSVEIDSTQSLHPDTAIARLDEDKSTMVISARLDQGLTPGLTQKNHPRPSFDPFNAKTVVGDPGLVLEQIRLSRSHLDALDPESELADKPECEPSKPSTNSWDRDTSAAVLAENIRVKPQLRLDDVHWDENDFPLYEEETALSPSVATRTIALDGDGVMVALTTLMGVSPLLSQLDMDGCKQLIESSEVTQCFAGQLVFGEGDPGSSLFLLANGKAAVERQGGVEHIRRVSAVLPGTFFGEASLLADTPREASVRILEDALLLELDRPAVQQLVSRNSRILTVLTRFLRARLLSVLMMDSPLFHQLSVDERARLAPLIHLHKLNAGQPVARRGQVLTGYCTVMAGVLRRFNGALGTGSRALSNLGPGSSFGSGCLSGQPSPFSIAAETGCWLLRLPADDLANLVERYPELLATLEATEAV